MGRDLALDGVPEKAAEAFDEFADREFDGNRAMALRELVMRERLRDEVRAVEAGLSRQIRELDRRLTDLESGDEDEDQTAIETVG